VVLLYQFGTSITIFIVKYLGITYPLSTQILLSTIMQLLQKVASIGKFIIIVAISRIPKRF